MEKDFTGEGTEDTIGHGTAVALIGLALADAAGTEPDLISVKVVGRRGRGRRSDYLDALHWLASLPAQRPGEKLTVGMSLGLLPPASGCRGTCDVCEAAVTLSRSDVVVTVAAGNFGLERTTCPGNAARYRDDHAILSVGAADYNESGFGSVMGVGERRFDIDKPTAAYLEGMACAERDEASRAEALLQEAATFGHRPAMINLGVLLYRRGEYEQAETWLRKATAQNDPAGLYALGLALLAKGSLEDAQHWLLASAEAGADAAEALDRVERRLADARAEKTYRRKAEHGDARAAYELAVVLSRQDVQEEAEFWYRHAAALGDPDAMNDLGVRLARRGEIGEAIKTWLPAAKNGHGPAGENLRRAVEMLRAGG